MSVVLSPIASVVNQATLKTSRKSNNESLECLGSNFSANLRHSWYRYSSDQLHWSVSSLSNSSVFSAAAMFCGRVLPSTSLSHALRRETNNARAARTSRMSRHDSGRCRFYASRRVGSIISLTSKLTAPSSISIFGPEPPLLYAEQ